jgi:hypothetical protein
MAKNRITGLENIAKGITGKTITNCKVSQEKMCFHIGDNFFVLSLNKDNTKLSSVTPLTNRDMVLLGIVSIEDYFKREDELNKTIDATTETIKEEVIETIQKDKTITNMEEIDKETKYGIERISESVF